MRITLLVLSLVAFAAGIVFLAAAKTAVHEIEAFTLFVVAATLLSAAAVIEALTRGLTRVDLTNDLLVKLAKDLRPAHEATGAQAATPLSDEPRYWVQTGTESSGPFPVTKIRELHKRKAIDDDTPLALDGGKGWRKTREIIGA